MFTRHGIGLREDRLKRLYGITVVDYERMFEAQGGLCKLCGQPPNNRWGKLLAVDHCHRTNRVRGLLCDKCNKGLGQFDDSPELLKKAIQYLTV